VWKLKPHGKGIRVLFTIALYVLMLTCTQAECKAAVHVLTLRALCVLDA
jgi:hypothetical protein